MKILVTGGCGYIGDCVVENLLKLGHQVTIIDNLMYTDAYMRPGVGFILGDISDEDFVRGVFAHSKFDAVVHLAAIVGDGACAANPERTVTVNERATRSLVDIVCEQNYPCKFIFASTCSVYGANEHILVEDSTTNPLSLYAGTKLNAEEYVREVSDHLIFRLGTLFGVSTEHARLRNDLVVNVLTFKSFQGEKLFVFGGEQYRPLLHVKDAGRIFAEAISSDHSGTFILSAFNSKIIDIAKEIIQWDIDAQIEVTESKFEDLRNYRVSNLKALKAGFIPQLDLQDGIDDLSLALLRTKNVWNPRYHNEQFITSCS